MLNSAKGLANLHGDNIRFNIGIIKRKSKKIGGFFKYIRNKFGLEAFLNFKKNFERMTKERSFMIPVATLYIQNDNYHIPVECVVNYENGAFEFIYIHTIPMTYFQLYEYFSKTQNKSLTLFCHIVSENVDKKLH